MDIFDLELHFKMTNSQLGRVMIQKKVVIIICLLTVLSGCAQSTALLGPVYTMATSGNVYQASLSFGSDKAIKKMTGKSTGENIKDLLLSEDKEDEFNKLAKKRFKQNKKKILFSNQ